jgi:hypothetical protein
MEILLPVGLFEKKSAEGCASRPSDPFGAPQTPLYPGPSNINILFTHFLENSFGNFSPAMRARNQLGIGLSYRPASLCSLATQFQTRFLESIPRPIAGLKLSTQFTGKEEGWYTITYKPSFQELWD